MTRLLKRNPDLKPAALLLAAAYGSLDRFDDAAIVLQRASKARAQIHKPRWRLA